MLRRLLTQADNKLPKLEKEESAESLPKNIKDMISLIRARYKGDYVRAPLKTVLKIVGALLYFVMIFDVVPDFIPGAGFVDDISVLLLTVRSVQKDLKAFRLWKESKKQEATISAPSEQKDDH